MIIYSYNQYIKEKHGVSEPSIQFVDIINDKCYNSFIDFYHSDKNKLDNYIDKIDYNSIKDKIKDSEVYDEFPVIGFELIYLFRKFKDNQFKLKFPNTHSSGINLTIGGWAAGFGNKNWKWYSKIHRNSKVNGIILQIGIEINCNISKFSLEKEENSLKDGINSTFWHELNHSFEHYKRTINKSKSNKKIWDRSFNTSITYAAENRYKFPKQIYKFWYDNFLEFIYISEDFELRSNIQEIAYFIKKYPKRDITEFTIYKNADKMEKFNADDFYRQLNEKISTYNNYTGIEESISSKLKDMWIDSYKKQLSTQKATSIISIKSLEDMSCAEFIKYWGKKINKNGTYLKRKIFKLKSSLNNE